MPRLVPKAGCLSKVAKHRQAHYGRLAIRLGLPAERPRVVLALASSHATIRLLLLGSGSSQGEMMQHPGYLLVGSCSAAA